MYYFRNISRRLSTRPFASITIIFSFFIFGCSHTTPDGKSISWPEGNPVRYGLQKICLSGEGKGRIANQVDKMSFSYESLLQIESKKWKMNISIPLSSDELIEFNFDNLDSNRVQVKGELYKRFRDYIKIQNTKEQKDLLKKYIQWVSYTLELIATSYEPQQTPYNCGVNAQSENNIQTGSCLRKDREMFQWTLQATNMIVEQKLDDMHSFVLIADRLQENFFQRIELSLYKNDTRPKTKLIGLELWTKQCF